MIELKKITKIYHTGKPGEFKALRDVDLHIRANSVTVLAGPSGSGKTTLLSIIGCMARPTAGRITVGDQETTSLPEKFLTRLRRSTFGFVFQDHNLVKGISVIENTMLPAYPNGEVFKPLKERAMGLLAQLKIETKAQRRIEELSGGERQRAAIARAVITEPRAVLADEPTGNLDRKTADQIFQLMLRLNQELNTTLIVVTHDPYLAGRMDKVYALVDVALQRG